MEFAIVLVAFLGLGYALDRWLDTKPVFMIVLAVLSLVGQFASMWYGYDARMTQLEGERAARTTGARRDGKGVVGGQIGGTVRGESAAAPGGKTSVS